jgi:cation:H+ antiporter
LFFEFIVFIISLGVLIWGADVLVAQSEKIALHFGISEYVIGATLVALGTSLPEMAASITASLNNKPALAVSNVIGSNILNITLVLATVFMVSKKEIKPNRDFFAKDSSWALFPVLIFAVMASQNQFDRFDGLLLAFLMVAYIMFLIRSEPDALAIEAEDNQRDFRWNKTLPMLFLGFILVIFGADYTVDSASKIAKALGVSEWIIGIIMVSLGTSMPELVVSIVASLKGKADMAIGNIIGSNMANITVVLGGAALVNGLKLDMNNYIFDIGVMVVATFMLVFITANRMYSKSAAISLFVLLALFLRHTLAVLGE